MAGRVWYHTSEREGRIAPPDSTIGFTGDMPFRNTARAFLRMGAAESLSEFVRGFRSAPIAPYRPVGAALVAERRMARRRKTVAGWKIIKHEQSFVDAENGRAELGRAIAGDKPSGWNYYFKVGGWSWPQPDTD